MSASEIFLTIFIGCAIFQFFFPVLAGSIKARMAELGYDMQASTFWSAFNFTAFWSEAREKNKEFNDPKIKRYLLVRTVWWAVAIASFIGFGVCVR